MEAKPKWRKLKLSDPNELSRRSMAKKRLRERTTMTKETIFKILEDNRNETLWGDEDSNEVMKVSIDSYIEAVKTEIKKFLS